MCSFFSIADPEICKAVVELQSEFDGELLLFDSSPTPMPTLTLAEWAAVAYVPIQTQPERLLRVGASANCLQRLVTKVARCVPPSPLSLGVSVAVSEGLQSNYLMMGWPISSRPTLRATYAVGRSSDQAFNVPLPELASGLPGNWSSRALVACLKAC